MREQSCDDHTCGRRVVFHSDAIVAAVEAAGSASTKWLNTLISKSDEVCHTLQVNVTAAAQRTVAKLHAAICEDLQAPSASKQAEGGSKRRRAE